MYLCASVLLLVSDQVTIRLEDRGLFPVFSPISLDFGSLFAPTLLRYGKILNS